MGEKTGVKFTPRFLASEARSIMGPFAGSEDWGRSWLGGYMGQIKNYFLIH